MYQKQRKLKFFLPKKKHRIQDSTFFSCEKMKNYNSFRQKKHYIQYSDIFDIFHTDLLL